MAETPFVVSAELTAAVVAYKNKDCIADQLIPKKPVTSDPFKYTHYPVEEFFEVPDTRVGRRGEPRRIEIGGAETEASTSDYGLEGEIVHGDERKDRGKHNIRGKTALRLIKAVELDRERRVAELFFSPSNYLTNLRLALSGSAQFSDPASDPLGVLREMIDTPLQRPNTITMGPRVWAKLRAHPRVVKAIKNSFSGEGTINEAQLAEELGLERVIIGKAQMNVARKGRAMDLRDIWGNAISLTYLNPDFDWDTEGELTWAATAQYGTRVAMEYEDPKIGLFGATIIKTGESLVELPIARHAGFLISSVVGE
jgi:hypothetical protein